MYLTCVILWKSFYKDEPAYVLQENNCDFGRKDSVVLLDEKVWKQEEVGEHL